MYTVYNYGEARTETCATTRCVMPNMKEIRDMARQMGIRPTRMEKAGARPGHP